MQKESQKVLYINGTSVEFNKFIIDAHGNPINSIEFGNMYYGQKKEANAFLVNNTPKKFKFECTTRIGLHQENVYYFNLFFLIFKTN